MCTSCLPMQLHLSGVYADCDINWSVKLPMHRSIAKMLTLRGLNCHQAAVDAFYDPGLYVPAAKKVHVS